MRTDRALGSSIKYADLHLRNLSLHSCVRSSPWMEVWVCPFPEMVWALSSSPDFPTGHRPPAAPRSPQVDPRLSRNPSKNWRSPLPRARRSPAAPLQPSPTTASARRKEIKSKVARAGAWRHLPQTSPCPTLPARTPQNQRFESSPHQTATVTKLLPDL